MRISFITVAVVCALSSTEAFSPNKPFVHNSQNVRRKSLLSLRDTPSPAAEKEMEVVNGASPAALKEMEVENGANDTTAVSTAATTTLQKTQQVANEFVNDGPLAWMQQYLDMFGVEEGKSVYYGPIAVEVDESKRVSDEEASRRRQQALKEFTNIGPEERERRDQAGSVMTVLSAVYISWAALIADDGGFAGHVLRFLSVFPIFLAVGYKVSAKTGLCNIAQSGMWDVDGNGLAKIEDPDVARTILNRVNNMNFENLVKVAVPVAIFAALPQSASSSLIGFALLFAALYALQGKVPQN